jgi:hypothetical protein
MDAAFIKNGTITSAKIANLAVDAAKIANATITTAKIGAAQITSALIAGTIQSNNYTTSAGWQINKAGTATFNEVALRGAINGGAFTSYAWPPEVDGVYGTGFHLGPQGLLLGNSGSGKYFQVGANGDIYAPKFKIVGGVAEFSGDIVAGTVGGSNVGTTYVRSANFVSGSAGWNIDSGGNAEFNQITVRSGQVTGALLKAVKIDYYSGLFVEISGGNPVSTTNGPYYRVGDPSPFYLVGIFTMPAPETASHKIAAVVNVGSTTGPASQDLSVMLVANYSRVGTTIQGEPITQNGNSGSYALATNAAGVSNTLYGTATVLGVLVTGNNTSNTIQQVTGYMFGVR